MFMRSFYYCFLVFSFLLLPFSPKAKAADRDQKIIAEYINTFDSYQELTEHFYAVGFISKSDQQNILNFLKIKGVEVKKHFSRLITIDDQFKASDFSIKRLPNGQYKSSTGILFKPNLKESFFENYKKAYEAFHNEKSQARLLFYFLVPQASAQVKFFEKDSNLATALFGVLLQEQIAPVGQAVGNVLVAGLDRSAGGVINWVKNVVDWWEHGHVECLDGHFMYRNGSSSKLKLIAEDIGPKKTCDNWKKNDPNNIGAGRLCEWAQRAEIYFDQAYERSGDYDYVSDKNLKLFFPHGVPKCTEKNKGSVEKQVKQDLQMQLFKKEEAERKSGHLKGTYQEAKTAN